MELLKAVNMILPYFGENTITKIDYKHPTVVLITDVLEDMQKTLLSKGWWFNTSYVKLYPNSDGGLDAPENALSIVNMSTRDVIAIRDQRIFNVTQRSYKFEEPIVVRIIDNMDFEELPENVALWIMYRTAYEAYVRDYGYEDVLQIIQLKEHEADQKVNAEHLRNKKYSTCKSPMAWKYYNALRT
jgi:hypothetical protein